MVREGAPSTILRQCRTWRRRPLAPLLGVVLLSACSPYVYNQEIIGFSTGVDAVVSSYRAGQQAVDSIVVQQQQAADATARTRLRLLPGCTQRERNGTPPEWQDCAVVPFGAGTAPAQAPVQQALKDAAPAFDALKAYAASLAAVTAAADETALNQATQSLTAAAGDLAKEGARLKPAMAPDHALVVSAGNLISQGLAFYLDQRRLAVLRDAVPKVDPAVQVLGRTAQAALLTIQLQQLRELDRDLLRNSEPLEAATVGQLSEADYQSKRAALEYEVTAFNQARAADPAATVAAMVNAHHRLATALQDDTGKGVITAVQTFSVAAGQLKAAITAASAATTKAPAAATP
jgi:hypothetical protein